jgi:hypothetical protein
MTRPLFFFVSVRGVFGVVLLCAVTSYLITFVDLDLFSSSFCPPSDPPKPIRMALPVRSVRPRYLHDEERRLLRAEVSHFVRDKRTKRAAPVWWEFERCPPPPVIPPKESNFSLKITDPEWINFHCNEIWNPGHGMRCLMVLFNALNVLNGTLPPVRTVSLANFVPWVKGSLFFFVSLFRCFLFIGAISQTNK